MWLNDFIIAFFLTLAIELLVAYALGFRKKEVFVIVALVNVITHPLMHYLLLVMSYYRIDTGLFTVTLLEAGVVLVEFGLLLYVFNKDKKKWFTLSLVSNTVSYLIGIMLFWM